MITCIFKLLQIYREFGRILPTVDMANCECSSRSGWEMSIQLVKKHGWSNHEAFLHLKKEQPIQNNGSECFEFKIPWISFETTRWSTMNLLKDSFDIFSKPQRQLLGQNHSSTWKVSNQAYNFRVCMQYLKTTITIDNDVHSNIRSMYLLNIHLMNLNSHRWGVVTYWHICCTFWDTCTSLRRKQIVPRAE